MAAGSLGRPWQGDYIFSSGNLILAPLHDVFLENGARTAKLRAYRLTDNPAARRMLGYLFTRGGVHAHAYALALEQLTGCELKKMLPIPNPQPEQIPESRPFLEEDWHRRLYRFSTTDHDEIKAVWQGQALDGLGPLKVRDGPPEGGPQYELHAAPEAFIPNYHPKEILEVAQKLYNKARLTVAGAPGGAALKRAGPPQPPRARGALRRPADPGCRGGGGRG